MKTSQAAPRTIDEYIAAFPADVQPVLEKFRQTIRKAAPQAHETISYGMPTFLLKGRLVYFAAHKDHIGFYPRKSVMTEFAKEAAPYKHGQATLQFRFDERMPYGLVSRIVKW